MNCFNRINFCEIDFCDFAEIYIAKTCKIACLRKLIHAKLFK